MTIVAAASLSSGLCDALDLSAFSLASRSIIIPLGPFPEADVGISCPHICGRGSCRTGLDLPRWLMTLTIVATVWGIFTAGLIILLIYRSTLTMHEDEQLFLNDASSHMQAEQTELVTKVNRLRVPV